MTSFQPLEILRAIPKIFQAFPMTMLILFASLFFSLLIGALFAVMSLSGKKVLMAISKGYVSFMRGVPTLILIFLIYLGLPQVLRNFGIDMSGISLTAYIIACLSLSVSANMSEMMRSAYLAVDKGQREAAYSIGMNPPLAFFRIIFPQALGIAIPTLGNNIIMLFKETSLAFTIGVIDMMGKARAVSAANYGATKLEIYIAAGIVFWILCFLMEKGTKLVEKAYTKGRR